MGWLSPWVAQVGRCGGLGGVTISLAALGTAFALVLPAELPDKTMVATLLLASRYRARPVFAGVAAAFAVQCGIAVAFGGLLTLLPGRVTAAVVALLFGIGSFVLLRESFGSPDGPPTPAGDSNGEHDQRDPNAATPSWRVALICFGVLFTAEFGDASQLATAALTARTGQPLSVGVGAWLALLVVAGIAVLVGSRLGARIPRRAMLRVTGVVFGVIALLAAAEAV